MPLLVRWSVSVLCLKLFRQDEVEGDALLPFERDLSFTWAPEPARSKTVSGGQE